MASIQTTLEQPKVAVRRLYPLSYFFRLIVIHYIFMSSAVIVGVFSFHYAGPNFDSFLGHSVANYFNQFDVGWYNRIAKIGYVSTKSTAFFPIWPLIVRALGENIWLELVVSNLLFVANTALLYRVTESLFNERTARTASWLFVFSPMSIYFNIGYSENVFMLTTLLCVLSYTTRTKWGFLWSYLAALTRPPGILVGLLGIRTVIEGIRARNWGHVRYGLLFGVSSLCGLLTFMVYLRLHGFSPIGFVQAQHYWRDPAFPFSPIVHAITKAVTSKTDLFPFAFDFIVTLFTIVVWIVNLNKLPWEFSAYSFCYLALTLSSQVRWSPLASDGRIVMGLFTGYVMCAPLLKHRLFRSMYAALGSLASMLGLIGFMHGYWVE